MEKIGLIGAAGLGRSTFAKEIAKEKNLVFLPSKNVTRPILKKYDWQYGNGGCVEKFLAKKDIEFELVSERIYQESLLVCGFVTDRTTLECFCYALLRAEEYSDNDLSILEKICKDNMKKARMQANSGCRVILFLPISLWLGCFPFSTAAGQHLVECR